MKITKRKDGRYQCNIYIGTDPVTGKKIQRTVGACTKSECRKRALELMSEPEELTTDRRKVTFAVWCDEWLSDYCNSYSPGTLYIADGHVRNHIVPFFKKRILLSDVTPVLCQKFVNSLSKKLSPKTVRNISGTLHKIFSTAVRIGYIKDNPSDCLDLPKRVPPKIRPMDEDEIRVFLAVDDTFSPVYRLAIYTGMRLSELLGLTWDRVDFDNNVIIVDRQLDRSGKGFAPTKHRKVRRVPLNRNAGDTLRRVRMTQNENRIRNVYFDNPLGLVLTNDIGHPISRQTLEKHFRKVVSSIGLEGTRFHDLRHTYAVLNLRAGVDPKTISETLGHYSVAFTLDTYAFVTSQMMEEASKKFDNFLAGV